ncbi:MAG TPA: TonB-dependent receptor, partial [Elusimicrobiales bacterium]|nr:TonB-dependent receptor [Elusimicrobiales bacterium]
VSRTFRTHSGRAAWSGERDGVSWQASANYQREDYFRLNEYFRGASYYRADTHGIRADAGAQTSLSLRGPAGFDPTFGLDYRRGMVDAADLQTRPSLSYARDQGRMDIFAPYAQVVKEVSGVRLQAGLRYDNAYFHNGYYSNTSPGWGPANGPLDTHRWENFSPKISAGWDYAEGFSQYVSYGRSFRAPPLEDMCLSLMRGSGSAARFTMANPRLRPEKVGTAETGFRMNPAKGVYLDPGAYVSLGEDFIYEINTGDTILINGTSTPVYKKWNVSRVKIYGAEVPLRSVFGPVTVSASYGWSESRILRFTYNTALQRKILTYAPRHLLSLGMEYRSGTSTAGAEWRYKSRQYADDANTAGLGAYGTLSLSASRRLTKTISARIRADNVLDERYTESLTDMAPGRTVTATLEAEF